MTDPSSADCRAMPPSPESPSNSLIEHHLSQSETDTSQIAAALAAQLRPGDIVLLRGELGTGKSVFCRALIRALAQDSSLTVPSPTFTLVQTYDTPRAVIWHFDLYRLKNADDVYELGWDDACAGGIVLVEWPERLAALTPSRAITLTLHIADRQRHITITRPA